MAPEGFTDGGSPLAPPAGRAEIPERPSAPARDLARTERSHQFRRRRPLIGRTQPQPYVAPGRSALLHVRLVGLIALVGLLLGVGAAAARHPRWAASEQLYVGKTLSLNNTAAIPGLADAANQIASDYSRLISTSTVQADAARRLGHPGHLGGTLSATEIPQSPQISVDAKAGSQAAAVALADAGSKALMAAVQSINSASSGQLQGLLDQYQSLQSTISNDQGQVGSLQSQITSLRASGGSASQIGDLQRRLTDLQTEISADQLKASAVQNQYTTSYAPLQQQEQVVSSIGPAQGTGSDRTKYAELLGLIGLVVGLLVGIAVASLRDLRVGRAAPASA